MHVATGKSDDGNMGHFVSYLLVTIVVTLDFLKDHFQRLVKYLSINDRTSGICFQIIRGREGSVGCEHLNVSLARAHR